MLTTATASREVRRGFLTIKCIYNPLLENSSRFKSVWTFSKNILTIFSSKMVFASRLRKLVGKYISSDGAANMSKT